MNRSAASFSAALAALAAMGITTNAQVAEFLRMNAPRTKRRRPHRTTWGLSKYHTAKRRLVMSRGPGSISCKADVTQLCNQRQYAEARTMVLEHEQRCGEVLFPGAWWRDINALEV
jgi:hypothetical protein